MRADPTRQRWVWARYCLAFTVGTLAMLIGFKLIFDDPLPYGTVLIAPLLGLWLGTVFYRSRRRDLL